jgi:hypothetical protein
LVEKEEHVEHAAPGRPGTEAFHFPLDQLVLAHPLVLDGRIYRLPSLHHLADGGAAPRDPLVVQLPDQVVSRPASPDQNCHTELTPDFYTINILIAAF